MINAVYHSRDHKECEVIMLRPNLHSNFALCLGNVLERTVHV